MYERGKDALRLCPHTVWQSKNRMHMRACFDHRKPLEHCGRMLSGADKFMHNYCVFLPIGEKSTDPPEKKTDPRRNELLDEYESIQREVFTLRQAICDLSAPERAP